MNKKIETLHPKIREDAQKCIDLANSRLTGRAKVFVVYCLRTNKEQDDLYSLGRTKVNPDGKSASRPLGYKVTNAKGGQSIHNYGLALDFALMVDGKTLSWNDVVDYDGDNVSDWMEVVKSFEENGWEWGGRWSSFIDKPHLQKTFGHSWRDLRSAKRSLDGYVII